MQNRREKNPLPPTVVNEVNRLLLAGKRIKQTADALNVSYSKVSSLRNKLVKANVLKPLVKFHKRPNRSKTAVIAAQIATAPVQPVISTKIKTSKQAPTMLYVNGVRICINNAREVFVNDEAITVNY